MADSLTGIPVVKCVLLGNSDAGKTSLLRRYARINGLHYNEQTRELVTAFSGQKCIFQVREDDESDSGSSTPSDCSLSVADGEVSKPSDDVHVYLLCASVKTQSNVEKTVKELLVTVTSHIGVVPFVLIGTQIDKRMKTATRKISHECFDVSIDRAHEPMPFAKAAEFGKRIGARGYIECSAETGEGLDEVLEEAFAVGFRQAMTIRRGSEEKERGDDNTRKPSCITQ